MGFSHINLDKIKFQRKTLQTKYLRITPFYLAMGEGHQIYFATKNQLVHDKWIVEEFFSPTALLKCVLFIKLIVVRVFSLIY